MDARDYVNSIPVNLKKIRFGFIPPKNINDIKGALKSSIFRDYTEEEQIDRLYKTYFLWNRVYPLFKDKIGDKGRDLITNLRFYICRHYPRKFWKKFTFKKELILTEFIFLLLIRRFDVRRTNRLRLVDR
jgi:hypothetical protein